MSEISNSLKTAQIPSGVNFGHSEQYFIFTLNKCLFAVPALQVLEAVYLPELVYLNTAPPEIVGVFDLRGTIIPVIDLSLRLKLPKKSYAVSDCVLIIRQESQQFGIIVDSVYDVASAQMIDNDAMLYAAELNQMSKQPLLVGSLKKEHLLITLLNPAVLLQQDISSSFALLKEDTENGVFCLHSCEQDREIFKERARNLRQTVLTEDSSEDLAVAAVLLGGEYFGVELAAIHEFTEFKDIVPIPGTPAYIKGCMNLRGNVITLLDVRKLLNLNCANLNSNYKAIIIEYQEVLLGVLVDSIIEIIYVHPEKVSEVPISVAINGGNKYLTGEVSYQNKLLTLIDFSLLLKNLA
jgi:purine-binding chemotaxis protein CheW